MESDGLVQARSVADVLLSQVEIVLAMLSRPAVQRQVLAAVLILFIAWLLPEGARRWRKRRQANGGTTGSETTDSSGTAPAETRRRRWVAALYHLLTPLLALILLSIAVRLFVQQGYPNGLLDNFTTLIWIWLVYRALLSLLYARYGEAVRPYQRRIVTPLFVLLIILQLIDTLPGSFTSADVNLNLGIVTVKPDQFLVALLALYVFILAAWLVEQFMVRSLPKRLDAEPGVVESFATLTRYALLALGIIVFLGLLGLDFTSLAIIAGGLSVGIGIGLQDLVANFVSGLVLLFEQSLKPGDVVELDGRISQVEKISLRATIVRTRTNEELIIPNANFTNQQLKNLTKSDRLVRIIVPFGVSYKSDPELVRQLAIDTGQRHPLVLADPPPVLLFRGYGDSSIDFDLIVSVNRPELMLIIKSDLYYMLWKVLKENGITIPFPQRDLNLGDGWQKLNTDPQTT